MVEREWHITDVNEGLVDADGVSKITRYVTVVGYGDNNGADVKCAAGERTSIPHGGADGYYLSINTINSFSTNDQYTTTAVCFPDLTIEKEETFSKKERLYEVVIQIEKTLGGGSVATVTAPLSGWVGGGKKTITYKGKKIFTGIAYKTTAWTTEEADEDGNMQPLTWTQATFVDATYQVSRVYVAKRMFFPGKIVQSNIHPEVTSMDFSEPPDPPGGSCSFGAIAQACFDAAGVTLAGVPSCSMLYEAGFDNSMVWATCADWNPMPLSQVVQWITSMTGQYLYADEENNLQWAAPAEISSYTGGSGGGCTMGTGDSYDMAIDMKSVACYCRGKQFIVGGGFPSGMLVSNSSSEADVIATAMEMITNATKYANSTSIRGTLDTVPAPSGPVRSYSVNISFLVSLSTAASYLDNYLEISGAALSQSVELVL